MIANNNENLKPVCRKHRDNNAPPKPDPSIAPIINELDELFDRLNEKFFENALLKPVITLSPKGSKSGKSHCTDKKVWADTKANRYFEINIYPEYLSQSVEVICEVLLHEMVHLSEASGMMVGSMPVR